MNNATAGAFASAAMREYSSHTQAGLTKREYMASLAMQGLLFNSAPTTKENILKVLGLNEDTEYIHIVHYPRYLAHMSTAFADALLRQLESTYLSI